MLIVKAQEGQSIQVGDRTIKVVAGVSPGVVSVRVDGEDDLILIGWDRKLMIFPDVHVTVPRTAGFSQIIRFLFDAPKSIRIRDLPYDASK